MVPFKKIEIKGDNFQNRIKLFISLIISFITIIILVLFNLPIILKIIITALLLSSIIITVIYIGKLIKNRNKINRTVITTDKILKQNENGTAIIRFEDIESVEITQLKPLTKKIVGINLKEYDNFIDDAVDNYLPETENVFADEEFGMDLYEKYANKWSILKGKEDLPKLRDLGERGLLLNELIRNRKRYNYDFIYDRNELDRRLDDFANLLKLYHDKYLKNTKKTFTHRYKRFKSKQKKILNELKKNYELFEVPFGSNKELIKEAYRKKLKENHPDLFRNDPEKRKSSQIFMEKLNKAYKEIIKYLEKEEKDTQLED